jgi:hypothetical protein
VDEIGSKSAKTALRMLYGVLRRNLLSEIDDATLLKKFLAYTERRLSCGVKTLDRDLFKTEVEVFMSLHALCSEKNDPTSGVLAPYLIMSVSNALNHTEKQYYTNEIKWLEKVMGKFDDYEQKRAVSQKRMLILQESSDNDKVLSIKNGLKYYNSTFQAIFIKDKASVIPENGKIVKEELESNYIVFFSLEKKETALNDIDFAEAQESEVYENESYLEMLDYEYDVTKTVSYHKTQSISIWKIFKNHPFYGNTLYLDVLCARKGRSYPSKYLFFRGILYAIENNIPTITLTVAIGIPAEQIYREYYRMKHIGYIAEFNFDGNTNDNPFAKRVRMLSQDLPILINKNDIDYHIYSAEITPLYLAYITSLVLTDSIIKEDFTSLYSLV